ncbi:hypothetical protein Pcinc_033006 [Petrolisthes cinctipes]|uniref:Uncharacterized protein n=1 Tax=Petrolisthes cinctipes TaxID=88211 RepID=A0AAE1JZN4_PETCI|nr:hypothetical protein Pcinc_033006 [Petrolisthes cinctipes]
MRNRQDDLITDYLPSTQPLPSIHSLIFSLYPTIKVSQLPSPEYVVITATQRHHTCHLPHIITQQNRGQSASLVPDSRRVHQRRVQIHPSRPMVEVAGSSLCPLFILHE